MGILHRIVRIKGLKKSQKGVAAVEMALLAPVFFLFFMGIVELSLMLFVQQMLESATYNASRLGKTGYTTESETQVGMVRAKIITQLGAVGNLINTDNLTITMFAYDSLSDLDNPSATPTTGAGIAQQIVVYTISYTWSFFTPLLGDLMGDSYGHRVLSARMVVKNEPYSTD